MFVLALALTSACAQSITGTRPNIPATRDAIQGTIDHDGGGRKIVSMGKVGFDRAVVYTETGADATAPHEEVWVKAGSHWQPSPATAGGGSASSAIN